MPSFLLEQIRTATVGIVLWTILCGVIYPAAVTLVGQTAFPKEATGSIVQKKEQRVGSTLIAQAFASDRYFWGRPSATTPGPCNSMASSGSNQGQTHPSFMQVVKERSMALRLAHPSSPLPIPIDLVTASGSGLDPHISPHAAHWQVARVAAARKMDVQALNQLIEKMTEGRTWGLWGEPRVNVLLLNMALDD